MTNRVRLHVPGQTDRQTAGGPRQPATPIQRPSLQRPCALHAGPDVARSLARCSMRVLVLQCNLATSVDMKGRSRQSSRMVEQDEHTHRERAPMFFYSVSELFFVTILRSHISPVHMSLVLPQPVMTSWMRSTSLHACGQKPLPLLPPQAMQRGSGP